MHKQFNRLIIFLLLSIFTLSIFASKDSVPVLFSDNYIAIMEYLPCNSKTLNTISRMLGASESIAKGIVRKFTLSEEFNLYMCSATIRFDKSEDKDFEHFISKILQQYFNTFSSKAVYQGKHIRSMIKEALIINKNFNLRLISKVLNPIFYKLKNNLLDKPISKQDCLRLKYYNNYIKF